MNNYNNEPKINSQLNKSNGFGDLANNNTPILFTKKIKKFVVKPLKHIYSDTGRTRHFTPAAQEWFNSIYSFNKNSIKTLPTADKNLMKLLKSYFNFDLKLKPFKTKRIATRYKRLSANKIFVGKGDIKHTNGQLIVTFYVYNTQRSFILKNLSYLKKCLKSPNKRLRMYVNRDRYNKTIITYNRPFTRNEYLGLPGHSREWYFSYILYFVNKLNQYYSNINKWYETLTNLIEKNILNENEKYFFFNKYADLYTFNYPDFNFYKHKCSLNYVKNYTKNRGLLKLNKIKFSHQFIENLKGLVQNIYNKSIVFNIVNLRKMHLNSDIFTQAVSLKLRNRDNKLYRVLKSSLRKLKIRNVSRARRLKKGNIHKNIVNQIRNDYIHSMFTKNNVKDRLNNLLLEYFPSSDNLRLNILNFPKAKRKIISLENYIYSILKHRQIRGIKVEAKGRLTRRFTASRSVFKMRWKGGLKNVDSSFKGLSAIMLRGYVKSNVQYSLLNSKNRNGAFGVKGWVSNK